MVLLGRTLWGTPAEIGWAPPKKYVLLAPRNLLNIFKNYVKNSLCGVKFKFSSDLVPPMMHHYFYAYLGSGVFNNS